MTTKSKSTPTDPHDEMTDFTVNTTLQPSITGLHQPPHWASKPLLRKPVNDVPEFSIDIYTYRESQWCAYCPSSSYTPTSSAELTGRDTVSLPIGRVWLLLGPRLRIWKQIPGILDGYFHSANLYCFMVPCIQMQNNQCTEIACMEWNPGLSR